MDAAALQLEVPGSIVAMNERDGKAAILATAARMLRHLGKSAFGAIGEISKAKRGKDKRMANARQTHGKRMADAWQTHGNACYERFVYFRSLGVEAPAPAWH